MTRSLPRPTICVVALVDHAEIAGDEETVGPEFRLWSSRHPPVALEHVRSLHLDHADLAFGEMRARIGIGDAQRHAGQRKADRAGDAIAP